MVGLVLKGGLFMTKINTFFKLLFVLFFVFGAAGCNPFGGDEEEETKVEEEQPGETQTDLESPTNLSIDDNMILSWNDVDGASEYVIEVDEHTFNTTSSNFDLSSLDFGEHSIKVKAMGDDGESNFSSPISFFASSNTDYILENTLLLINEDYLPDMNEGDFETDKDYLDYTRMVNMLTIYSENMSYALHHQDAVSMFEDMISIPQVMEVDPSASNLQVEFDKILSYNIPNERLVGMLYEIGYEMNNILIEDSEGDMNDIALELVSLFDEEEELLKTNLSFVINYIEDVYFNITPNMISTLDGDLSSDELFTLKDEIVYTLQSTLPHEDDVSDLYLLKMLFVETISGQDLSSLYHHASTMAETKVNTMDIMLAFADEMITPINTDKLMTSIDDMIYYDEYGHQSIHFDYFLDTTLFIGNNLTIFYETHQNKFDNYSYTELENMSADMFGLMINIAKHELTFEGDPLYDVLIMLEADIESIMDGLFVLSDKTSMTIDYYLDSDAQLFYDLYSFILNAENNEDDFLYMLENIGEVQNIINEFSFYNDILLDEPQIEEIKAVLDIVKIPLMINLLEDNVIENTTDFEIIFNNLRDPVANILLNFSIAQKHMVDTLGGYDIEAHINELTIYEYEMNLIIPIVGIHLIDDIFTPGVEGNFDTILLILRDDILKNEELQPFLNIAEDPDVIYNQIDSEMAHILSEVRDISEFDFATGLTQAQEEQIYDLMLYIGSFFPQPEQEIV